MCPNTTELVLSAVKGIASAGTADYTYKVANSGAPLGVLTPKGELFSIFTHDLYSQPEGHIPNDGTICITREEEDISCEGLVENVEVAEWLRPHAIRLLEIGSRLKIVKVKAYDKH